MEWVLVLMVLHPATSALLKGSNLTLQFRGEGSSCLLAPPGDTSLGCWWRVRGLDGRTCCYASPDHPGLCSHMEKDPRCRQELWVMTQKEEGQSACGLLLEDLQLEESGEYQAMFPARPQDGVVFSMEVWEQWSTTEYVLPPGRCHVATMTILPRV